MQQQDLAKKMSEDIDEMEKMLNAYLEFSSTQKNIKSEIFDLTEMLKKITDNYKNNKIDLSYEKNFKINGRPILIQRCFTNLIDNALSYGSKVQILLKKTVNNTVITVDDDGPGIPEKEKLNVFKPFYRIDKSRGQNKSGVGLGLTITNDIIRSHGGSIELEKSNLGGLRVKILLPT